MQAAKVIRPLSGAVPGRQAPGGVTTPGLRTPVAQAAKQVSSTRNRFPGRPARAVRSACHDTPDVRGSSGSKSWGTK
jgi:hypothetical protein